MYYQIRNDCLVIENGSALPPICVRTGQRNVPLVNLIWTRSNPRVHRKVWRFSFYLASEEKRRIDEWNATVERRLLSNIKKGFLATLAACAAIAVFIVFSNSVQDFCFRLLGEQVSLVKSQRGMSVFGLVGGVFLFPILAEGMIFLMTYRYFFGRKQLAYVSVKITRSPGKSFFDEMFLTNGLKICGLPRTYLEHLGLFKDHFPH